MFSRPVAQVAGTQIFARREDDRQLLAYAMTLTAAEDLAMILPIPVPPGSPEDAVCFIDLEGYPALFDDLRALFPVPPPRGGGADLLGLGVQSSTLEVHRVGAFDASFVPRVADFERLDPRFRLPGDVWAQLPRYADWGFAVFKLRGGGEGFLARLMRKPRREPIHPMAFSFPSRDPERLFFPTVHVHDGRVHERADFDHHLYAQSGRSLEGFERSAAPASERVSAAKTRGLVEGPATVQRRGLEGTLANEDVWA